MITMVFFHRGNLEFCPSRSIYDVVAAGIALIKHVGLSHLNNCLSTAYLKHTNCAFLAADANVIV